MAAMNRKTEADAWAKAVHLTPEIMAKIGNEVPKLFALVHAKKTAVAGEPTQREILEVFWFRSSWDAETEFRLFNIHIVQLSNLATNPKKVTDMKLLYELTLNDEGKAIVADDPKIRAEALANRLKLDPLQGRLIDSIPKRRF